MSSLATTLKSAARAAVAGSLSFVLAGQPLLAEAAVKTMVAPAAAPMAKADRTLYALNRLTFGPRPGDVARVNAMGLDKWFEQQLNPGTIDDSSLEARLAEYPAMQMPVSELVARYPGPGALRQLENGKGTLPADPTERAMIEDQMAFYKLQKAKAEAKPANPDAANAPAVAGADPNAASAPAMTDPNAMAPTPKKGGKRQQAQANAGMDALGDTAAPDAQAMNKPIPAADISGDANVMAALGASGTLTRADAQRIAALAPADRMTAIMALKPADLVRMRTVLNQKEYAQLADGLSPLQRETLTALPGSLRMIALEAMESRLDRDIYSDRQLEAVMTDFWLNHFNVYVRKSQQEPYLLPAYERETIRPNALGNFETLLVATAKSPAMEVYLDNFRSVGPDSQGAARITQAQQRNPNGKLIQKASAGLNENYGRELMELHTLGVNGGYTQADVTNVAKVFTGWGLERGYQGGTFSYNDQRHEPGSKPVLGKTIEQNGENEGLEVLHMLATSPATANFISGKLAVRFVSDNPPQALVDRMADAFLKSNGDIKTVLRTMFHSPEFWEAQNLHAKVKTPLEFVVSAARASNLEVRNPAALVQALDKLGMPLYGMQTPNGYSWKADEWVSTGALVSRMNFSLVMTSDRIPGTRTDWTELLGEVSQAAVVPASYSPDAEDAAAKERKLEQILLDGPVSERTRATVLSQSSDGSVADQAATQFDLGGQKGKGNYMPRGQRKANQAVGGNGPDDPQAAVMAGLLLGSPEFQRR